MEEARPLAARLELRGAVRDALARTRRPRIGFLLVVVAPMVFLGVLVVVAVFAPLLAPYDPLVVDLPSAFQPPVFFGGDWHHVLGTDDLGRDVLTRIIYGARVSLVIAVVTVGIGCAVGTTLGLLAGFVGGWVDALLMRLADLVIVFPVILLALLLAIAQGAKVSNVVVTLAFVVWASFARVVRSQVLVIREQDYVKLARIAGVREPRIVVRHVLPNVLGTVFVLISLQAGWVILAEAALSFLGAGVPVPQAAWGSMTALGRQYMETAWWISTLPALAITLTVLSINVLGDWLRDRLDPRLRVL